MEPFVFSIFTFVVSISLFPFPSLPFSLLPTCAQLSFGPTPFNFDAGCWSALPFTLTFDF
jgi:hypothetical protein